MRLSCTVLAVAIFSWLAPTTFAAVYIGPDSGATATWNATASWDTATIPNAASAVADFTATNAGNRTVTVDSGATGFTVGSVSLTTGSNAFTNNINTGTTGSKLIFDNGGAGATITTSGPGTGRNTFNAPLVFNEMVTANVNQSGLVSTDSLNLVSTITGVGGFTKNGDYTATFGTNGKSYTGATILNGGRMRISIAARPTGTSSFTINNGAQLEIITAGTFTVGPGDINLNGNGPTAGPASPFPGAIRNTTNLAITITNPVVLQSDSTIHVQGSATGVTTLLGNVSGVGGLTAGANPHDANLGQLVLGGTNSYSGGSTARAGSLVASSASVNAFGTGNVTVESANLIFGGSAAKLIVQAGATNAIADTATLSLAGGNAGGVADDGYADLGTGINEIVASLMLGGVAQGAGTYGATGSGATNINDEYFAGAGILTVVPVVAGVSGDYNNNGVVDAADYVLWRDGGPLQNDPTAGVQPADYDFWRSRFGATSGSGSGAASAVPEPASLALVGLLISCLMAGRHMRATS